MSGIAAIFRKDRNAVDHDALERLAKGLLPYGRKYQAFQNFGACGLAYAHLPNTLQSLSEDQPVRGAGGQLQLVFDGRLDNREELAEALNLSTSEFKAQPDSWYALRCWERWGERAPENWVGEFAVLVWNMASQTLVGVRDQLGRRGLSYHETDDRIVIASSPRALFALPDIPKQVDEQKIADALVQLFHDGKRSFFKNIWRLQPGHRLIATSHGTKVERYWSPEDAPEVRLSSDYDYVEAARELLDTSVEACLRRSGEVGAFLSGGLDSSAVAVTALKHLDNQAKLPTFTWVPDPQWDGRCRPGAYGDETPYVEAIAAQHPRIELNFVRSEGRGLFHQLDDFLDYAGVAPRNAINLCWIHDINMEAQRRGINVLLEGGAGNMSLSWDGQGVFLEHWRNRAYGKLFRELLAGNFNPARYGYRLLKMFLLPLAPDVVNTMYLKARGHLNAHPVWHRASAINPDFAREMHVDERMLEFGWNFFMSPTRDPRQLRSDLLSGSFSNEAADIDQAFRALYGVEIRDPLADRRLVEFCLGLPEEQFWREGQSRWLVKRVMKDLLPQVVLNNRKGGEQLVDWHLRMTRDLPQMREELEAIADDPDTSDYIDVKRIRSFLENWPSETPLKPLPDHTYSYIPVSIGAALAAGRFVRRVKGSNR